MKIDEKLLSQNKYFKYENVILCFSLIINNNSDKEQETIENFKIKVLCR